MAISIVTELLNRIVASICNSGKGKSYANNTGQHENKGEYVRLLQLLASIRLLSASTQASSIGRSDAKVNRAEEKDDEKDGSTVDGKPVCAIRQILPLKAVHEVVELFIQHVAFLPRFALNAVFRYCC